MKKILCVFLFIVLALGAIHSQESDPVDLDFYTTLQVVVDVSHNNFVLADVIMKASIQVQTGMISVKDYVELMNAVSEALASESDNLYYHVERICKERGFDFEAMKQNTLNNIGKPSSPQHSIGLIYE